MHELVRYKLPNLEIISDGIEGKPVVEHVCTRNSIKRKSLHDQLQEEYGSIYNKKVFDHRRKEAESKSSGTVIITHKLFLYVQLCFTSNLLKPQHREEFYLQEIQVKLLRLLKHATLYLQVRLCLLQLQNLRRRLLLLHPA